MIETANNNSPEIMKKIDKKDQIDLIEMNDSQLESKLNSLEGKNNNLKSEIKNTLTSIINNINSLNQDNKIDANTEEILDNKINKLVNMFNSMLNNINNITAEDLKALQDTFANLTQDKFLNLNLSNAMKEGGNNTTVKLHALFQKLNIFLAYNKNQGRNDHRPVAVAGARD